MIRFQPSNSLPGECREREQLFGHGGRLGQDGDPDSTW